MVYWPGLAPPRTEGPWWGLAPPRTLGPWWGQVATKCHVEWISGLLRESRGSRPCWTVVWSPRVHWPITYTKQIKEVAGNCWRQWFYDTLIWNIHPCDSFPFKDKYNVLQLHLFFFVGAKLKGFKLPLPYVKLLSLCWDRLTLFGSWMYKRYWQTFWCTDFLVTSRWLLKLVTCFHVF